LQKINVNHLKNTRSHPMARREPTQKRSPAAGGMSIYFKEAHNTAIGR
jgi:hypothetical protein